MTAASAAPVIGGALADAAQQLARWLETGVRPDGLLTDNVFADLTLPRWRLQAEGADATFHLREDNHPFQGTIRVESLDATSRGFLLQFEERWEAEGQQWYCRELLHAALTNGRIYELIIYCTGDWDQARQREHRAAVHLIRP